MRNALRILLPAIPLACCLAAAPARAQLTDSQRAAARDLFKEGDALQRSGKFAEALDKFQRAQAVYDAPTNLLRIAECEAALGRLVESAEAFRAVLRAPLSAGSPPAFQTAVDQARAELAQVEPRVPRLVVDVQPARTPNLQLQIDGQVVPAALVGASMPLDPGSHRVVVSAPGFAPADQQVVLKEQEARTVSLALQAAPAPPPPPAAGPAEPEPPPPSSIPPPPPPIEGAPPPPPPQGSRMAVLVGAHLGWEIPTGKIPIDSSTNLDVRDFAASGPAFGLDGGLRFARQWYAGLTLDHAELGSGGGGGLPKVTGATSNTTAVGAVIGLIVNPDRLSFYGHLGLAGRWYNVNLQGQGTQSPSTYTSGEVLLGAGLWLPASRFFRVLPEATLSLGTFGPPSTGNSGSAPGGSSSAPPGHVLVMLGVSGFFSADL